MGAGVSGGNGGGDGGVRRPVGPGGLAPEKYRAQLDRSRAILENPGPLLADTRRMAYYSGALLLLGAQRAGLELRHSLSGQSKPLFSFLDRQFSQLPPVPLEQAALEAAAAVAAAPGIGATGKCWTNFSPPPPPVKGADFEFADTTP